jgi:threonine dehydrogenase-like Zn-dependent dehydrogenase
MRRSNLSLESWNMYSVAALLFVGVLLVALGLFAAGNMVVVGAGIVALFGAGAFETLGARRS